jgi:hypothetical protein
MAVPVTGADNVGHRASADGGNALGIGIPEGHGHQAARNERDDDPQKDRDDAHHARLAQLLKLHAEGRGDDAEVPHHAPAHQSDAGQQADIRHATCAASELAGDIGGQQSQNDGNGRTVDAPACEPARNPVGQPHTHANNQNATIRPLA